MCKKSETVESKSFRMMHISISVNTDVTYFGLGLSLLYYVSVSCASGPFFSLLPFLLKWKQLSRKVLTLLSCTSETDWPEILSNTGWWCISTLWSCFSLKPFQHDVSVLVDPLDVDFGLLYGHVHRFGRRTQVIVPCKTSQLHTHRS